jgi:hypothetical protein
LNDLKFEGSRNWVDEVKVGVQKVNWVVWKEKVDSCGDLPFFVGED